MAVNIHGRTVESTSGAKVCPFRSLLLFVDDGLTKEDLGKMVFLSKDVIGSERETEEITSGRDLFDIFIKRDVISKTSIDYLSDLLARIRRFDLRKELCKKWDAWKHTDPDDIGPLSLANKTETIKAAVHLLMVQGVSSQQQTQEHAVNFSQGNNWPTIPVLKIEGNDVECTVSDGELPNGRVNQQRKESDNVFDMTCQSPGCTDESLDMDEGIWHTDGKRPRLVHQKRLELGSSEDIYCLDSDDLQCALPFSGPSASERKGHLAYAGSRSSTISTDSLEEQKTGNNFLAVRNNRFLSVSPRSSRKSSIDSYSSSYSADSLEEPKTSRSPHLVRPGRRLSPKSSFESRTSSLSTDSLEEQNSPILEPDRALRTSVGS